MRHVFIADGRLHLRGADGAAREIESAFARDKADRAERRTARDDWKRNRDPRDPYANVLWSGGAAPPPFRPWRFQAVMVADEDTLFYVLTNGHDMGLFRYHLTGDREVRVSTANDFTGLGIDYSRADNQFVAGIPREGGAADLQIIDTEGRHRQIVSGGDSRDHNPCFSRARPREVLYQSAGIARDGQGTLLAYGPEAILSINRDGGALTTVLSDPAHDFLLPRDDAQGNLYCIRRPHRGPGGRSMLQSAADMLTFPFRFVGALFGFFTTFTRAFGGKGLRLGGPGAQPEPREKTMNILGEVINVASLRGRDDDELSLAPGAWELIRRSPDGRVDVLARRVTFYDIAPDGGVHCTNGFRVSRLTGGAAETLFKHRIIESVRPLAAAHPGAQPPL